MRIQGFVNYTKEAGNAYEIFFIEKNLIQIGKWTNVANYSLPELDSEMTKDDRLGLSIPLLNAYQFSVLVNLSIISLLIIKKKKLNLNHNTNERKK